MALGEGFILGVLLFSPVNIIPPTLHTYLHPHTALSRRTNGRSLGTPSKIRTISDIGREPDTNCFHSVRLQRLNILSNSAVGHNFLNVECVKWNLYCKCLRTERCSGESKCKLKWQQQFLLIRSITFGNITWKDQPKYYFIWQLSVAHFLSARVQPCAA